MATGGRIMREIVDTRFFWLVLNWRDWGLGCKLGVFVDHYWDVGIDLYIGPFTAWFGLQQWDPDEEEEYVVPH